MQADADNTGAASKPESTDSEKIEKKEDTMSNVAKLEVTLSGVPDSIEIDFEELAQLDILTKIHSIFEQNGKQFKDLLILGIAGPSGSGKTLLSNILTQYFNNNDFNQRNYNPNYPKQDVAFCFSGDGYHYTNEYLVAHNLRQIKGFPQTMNDAAFEQDLKNIIEMARRINGSNDAKDAKGAQGAQDESKTSAEDDAAAAMQSSVYKLPIYDRQIHDPRQNAVELNVKYVKILIIESLYTMHWKNIMKLCDLVLYIDVDIENSKQRVINRKLQCGYDLETILKYFEGNEKKTYDIVSKDRHLAHSIIKSDVKKVESTDDSKEQKITRIAYKQIE